MARVIVVLGLMIAITATMFWITRKPPVAEGNAAVTPQASATIALTELKSGKTSGADQDLLDKPDETQSLTSVEPRAVTNSLSGAAAPAATTAPASAQDVTTGPVAGAAPSIGTAGVDQKNTASFTGTATPGETISLMWDQKRIGQTVADASGNWSLEFKAPVSAKEHELMVTAQAKDGSILIGPQRAYIGPAVVDGGLPKITLKNADEVVKTLQEGGVATSSEPTTGIVVEKVAGGQDGVATLTGRADAGSTLKVAINGKAAGETVAGVDGVWAMQVENSSGKAAESLRIELFNTAGAKLDQTEVPYKVAAVPAKVAEVEKPVAVRTDYPAVLSSKPAKAIERGDGVSGDWDRPTVHDKPKYRVIKVRRGDSLWKIARRHLGNGKRWARFYRLNKRKIDNPDMIYPGQTLILPG